MPRKKTNSPKKTSKTITQYSDGREDRKDLAKTVEDLMSVKKRDPFVVANGENFDEAIHSMNLSQLQEIAVSAGVFPSGTKTTLKNKLLKEYDNRVSSRYGSSTTSKPIVDPKSKQASDILKLIND